MEIFEPLLFVVRAVYITFRCKSGHIREKHEYWTKKLICYRLLK